MAQVGNLRYFRNRGDNMEAFYQTVATFCFTLLGLWWGVVQFRHSDWMADANWRRMHAVSGKAIHSS